MARIRSIRPEFWKSEAIACHDFFTRLVFIGLWSYVDDNGVGVDNWRLVAAELFPLEEDFAEVSRDVRESIARLADAGRILRYTVDGKSYLAVVNWKEHQKVDRPGKARYPEPEDPRATPTPPSTSGNVKQASSDGPTPDEPSRQSRETPSTGEGEKGRRGEGENPPVPPRAVEPPAASDVAPPDGEPGPAERLVQNWMLGCTRRPPSRVVDGVGREVAQMLRDGIEPADIHRGLAYWQDRGMHPKALPSVVNQLMNARPGNVVALTDRRPSTTDQRVNTALQLAEKFAQEDPA